MLDLLELCVCVWQVRRSSSRQMLADFASEEKVREETTNLHVLLLGENQEGVAPALRNSPARSKSIRSMVRQSFRWDLGGV